MSEQWPGGLITKTPVTPSGPFEVSTASGVWTLEEAYQWKGDGLWPTAGNILAYYSTFANVSGQAYQGRGISVDSSSNVYLSGYSSDPTTDSVWVAKWPSDGTAPTWQREATDTSLSVTTVKAGSVIDSTGDIIIGCTGYDASDDHSIILKWDTNGTFQWGRNFGTEGREAECAGIGIDSSDNIYLWTDSTSSGFAEIVKWNSAGAIQFQKSATTAGSSVGNTLSSADGDMVITPNDYIIPVGKANSASGSGVIVGSVANISAAGVLDWHREIAGYLNGIHAVAADSSNNIYLGARAGSSPANVPYIMKLNSSGVKQWARKIEGSASGTIWSASSPRRMAVDSSDNVYMVSNGDINNSGSGGANNEAVMVFKYNSSGVLQWSRYIQNNLANMGSQSRITIDGSDMIIASAVRLVSSPSMTSMFYIKIPTDGSKTGSYTNPTYTGFTLTYGVLDVAESADTASSESSEDYTLATTTITEAATGMTSSTSSLSYDNDPL